jgi:MFS family permease
MRIRGISGNVLAFGVVSFLTDVSSEMIYPLLPLFLTAVLGAGPAFLGAIEGIAESTSALLKLVSGKLSDRVSRRKPLVVAGYGLSALARPLIALATAPAFVLAVRFCDRIGKGVRTSPRDALIADSVEPELRGRAYGFHRSMDHAGALLGPLLAAGLLGWFGFELRTVFWCAAIPGVLAVALLLVGVREQPRPVAATRDAGRALLPRGQLRTYLLILLLFTLGNSSDAFLLLRAGELGITPTLLPLLWAFFHLVKMLGAFPFGALSDRIGRRGVIVAGWGVYAAAYLGFALATEPWHIWLLFAGYGIFYGLTEGAEKALIADLAPEAERGGAFGWFNATIGLGALPASLLFGALWQWFGPLAAFGCGAALAAVAAGLLLVLVRGEVRHG